MLFGHWALRLVPPALKANAIDLQPCGKKFDVVRALAIHAQGRGIPSRRKLNRNNHEIQQIKQQPTKNICIKYTILHHSRGDKMNGSWRSGHRIRSLWLE
jgi:hypothetical protein